MAELRRNPLTQKWIIYTGSITPERLTEIYRDAHAGSGDAAAVTPAPCPYCPGTGNSLTPILWYSDGVIRYAREADSTANGTWDCKVFAAADPVFRIEDELNRKARRLYDTMGSPGAHEIIVMTPRHGRPVWEMDIPEITAFLSVYRERILDLLRDPRLGHQYAYHMHDPDPDRNPDHAVTNLIAAPFVPEKIQKELSGAHEWYAIKERCLFCDIYEEEMVKRDRGTAHGIIEETTFFSAYIPYFASHPFEVWIQPMEHVSQFIDIPLEWYDDLSRMISLVTNRLYRGLGPVAYLLSMGSRPNKSWGSRRGYWHSIDEDWHWRIRILPKTPLLSPELDGFFFATGSRINPLMPEFAAEYLRHPG